MDTRLELIEKLRISIEHDMKAVMCGAMRISQYDAITQNYLLFQILEKLDSMDKSLNLIAVQTRRPDETDAS